LVGLADARRIAARHRLAIAEGCDPVAERAAQRGSGTFTELADRYLNEHAKKRNKSWEQAAYLARKHLLPRWGKLDAKSISRADVRQLMTSIEAPIVANQALAAASAIFSWAVKMEIVTVNPVQGVERNEVTSRSRILSDTEVPLFWRGFESIEPVRAGALKVIPLLGQRPGEVCP
jgi:Phage integrase central domain